MEAILGKREEDSHQEEEGTDEEGATIARKLRDVINAKWQWLVALCLVALHEIIVFKMAYGGSDGCPRGYNGPGGLHDGGAYQRCTGGATGAVDRAVFGPNHMYNR